MADSINRVLAQTKQRPTLANLKRVCPQDLAHCEGFVWHLGSRIGKGSFGEVYLGWNSEGSKEVAVKVVRKEFFKQDPKVRENLEREIRILKLLKGCEYVVHLHHVQELKQHIVLVMELCEFDLDHLVKIKPFKEQDIIIFLYQLAQGMKALREQNIVHRDLKPGNILIKKHPTTGKMMIKLADFGFARHFKDEGMKPIDMTSLAGTPVFMAPEALRCVFHPGEHYDDKVDIWSIGSLLYKVIVGQCGFYAQLQDIPRILKHKGDAIAFERVPHSRKINYISELPPLVNDRLSESFRDKMNQLLRAMLKLDPAERMTFSEFYIAVDDIITSKIEVISLLHGSSMKVMNDTQLTVDSLTKEIYSHTHVQQQSQVLFSMSSQHFISPYAPLSQEHFVQLLDEAGGSRGHAQLYLLPINLVDIDVLNPDYNCLAGLGFVIDDVDMCVSQIVEHKLADEMVHMIYHMSAQQKAQLEGLVELSKFVSREVALFSSHGYKQLTELGHQALARANFAVQWLQQDLSSLSEQNQGQLRAQLVVVEQHKAAMEKLVRGLNGFDGSVSTAVNIELNEDDLTKAAATLADESKKLPKLRKDQIYNNCKTIYEDCQKLIKEVTEKVKDQLRPLWVQLSRVWSFSASSGSLRQAVAGLDAVLEQVSIERTSLLRSLSGAPITTTPVQGGGMAPPLLITTPGGVWNNGQFPGPPPQMSTWAQSPAPSTVEAIKREKEELRIQVDRLASELSTLRASAANNSGGEEEATIRPGAMGDLRPHSPANLESTLKSSSLTEDSVKAFEDLTGHLKRFCTTAERLRPGITASATAPRSPSSSKPKTSSSASTLYPSLLGDYSVISMEDVSSPPTPNNLNTLLPHALQLAELLQANSEGMVKTSARGTVTISANSGLVKIARPSEYEEGDIAVFHQVKLAKSKTSVPVVLHLEKPRPFIILEEPCVSSFYVGQRLPDLILGRLTEKPRRLRFEDHPHLAEDFGSHSGEFYKVRAEPTVLKFSAPHNIGSRSSADKAEKIDKKKTGIGGGLRRSKKGDFV